MVAAADPAREKVPAGHRIVATATAPAQPLAVTPGGPKEKVAVLAEAAAVSRVMVVPLGTAFTLYVLVLSRHEPVAVTIDPTTMPVVHDTVTVEAVTAPIMVRMPVEEPSVGKEPAGTGVHALLPAEAAKVPAGQGVQNEPVASALTAA